MNNERLAEYGEWKVKEHGIGYLGKNREKIEELWNTNYPSGWRISWELASGEILDYEKMFWKIYVAGYVRHFILNPDQAIYLTDNFAYAYDKYLISKREAFDPYALYNRPGVPNQFHNVALNIALESFLGRQFKGNTPIQVREGKPGTSVNKQPEGFLWSPGRIAAVNTNLIPSVKLEGQIWWQPNSVEDLYQKSKVLEAKIS